MYAFFYDQRRFITSMIFRSKPTEGLSNCCCCYCCRLALQFVLLLVAGCCCLQKGVDMHSFAHICTFVFCAKIFLQFNVFYWQCFFLIFLKTYKNKCCCLACYLFAVPILKLFPWLLHWTDRIVQRIYVSWNKIVHPKMQPVLAASFCFLSITIHLMILIKNYSKMEFSLIF